MADGALILVIEDDAGLARLQKTRLERAGYRVTTAGSAAEGLAQTQAQLFDLVVIDQHLPGGASGVQLFQQIQAAGRGVPGILVTGFSDEQIVLQALRAGFHDFVPKTPTYLDYLAPAIERVLKERHTERQLAQSRAQLARIIDTVTDAVLAVNEEGRVTVFNPAAEAIFGCPTAAAFGAAITRFLPAWPELLERCAPARAEEARRLRHCETVGQRADGAAFPAEVSLSRGALLPFWTCTVRDLTERKHAEDEHTRLVEERTARVEADRYVSRLQEQAHLLEMAHALVRDYKDRIIFWNRGTTQMYGWTPEEALGQNVHELLKTVFPAPAAQIQADLQKRGQWEGELIHTRKDGTTLVVASHWALHRDAQDRPAAVLEVNNDVTELKRLQDVLREADRRKDEFLAVLAHELRNPLAPIRNALHLMRLAKGNPTTVEQARDMMERQVKQMVRLIDDLLDLSRISRGLVQLRPEPIAMQDLVQAAVESSKVWIDEAGHTLTVAAPDEPILLDVDPLRIGQVLSNLLNNAAKYTEPGGQITLSAERVERADGTSEAVFRVRDTGIGIPPEMLNRIFEIFTQIEPTVDRTQGGLGIGLSLVRGLVHLHGGRVAAHSAGPGQGSEFVVHLPLRKDEPDSSRAPEEKPARPDAPAPAAPTQLVLAPLNVLIVDDNRDGARTLALLLETMGHQVRLAHDGYTAVSLARRHEPDVVFCDIGLPGLNGFEVARRLRQHPPFADLTLVALTGWGQEEDRRRSQEAGFTAHLVKPVEQQALAELLAAVKPTV